MTDLISIVIPVYNTENFLKDAIESILRQTYSNKEIIIIDDCSTDKSFEIAKSYESDIVKVFKMPQNSGQSAASNYGITKSKGSFIKLFDADDLMNKEHLMDQYLAIKHQPSHIAAGQIKRFFNNDLNTALHEPLANWSNLSPLEWLLIDNGKGLGMMQCGMFLIPREILVQSGYWDTSISMMNDFEFFPRLLFLSEKIIFTEKALVYYRSGNKGSLSNHLSDKALESAHQALIKTSNLILSKETSKRSAQILAMYWSDWAYIFYGLNAELYKSAVSEYKKLTGKEYSPKNSGYTKISDLIIGWKLTKKIKNYLSK
ncbi:glycosyltransferase family 2 protein [Pedobacter sp. SG918]|uniref:glycosyltransferase family 2 protein n=1 Tax=Pedobacter sp. SG918 TaxID=2587136 RepID=UPI00146CD68E|nr:glycosyltransferase family 2 protein [Pedobacter sp. SG918]NMN35335.1 glycosyltransferase involved in cell wall biosynthesis [Pedobacter sp. SG918]